MVFKCHTEIQSFFARTSSITACAHHFSRHSRKHPDAYLHMPIDPHIDYSGVQCYVPLLTSTLTWISYSHVPTNLKLISTVVNLDRVHPHLTKELTLGIHISKSLPPISWQCKATKSGSACSITCTESIKQKNYISTYTCIHVCLDAHTPTCTHTHVHTYTHAHTHAYTQTHTHTQVHMI